MAGPSKMGALRVVDRDEWVAAIKRAMKRHGGRVPDAAEELEVGPRQLFRWLTEPEFASVKRVENGLPRSGKRQGRRKKATEDVPTRKKVSGVIPARRRAPSMDRTG